MHISKFLSKIAFSGLMLVLPIMVSATISYDLYAQGRGSPYASLFSAFVGLYLGFVIVWKLLCLIDSIIQKTSHARARTAVRLRNTQRDLMTWHDMKVAHA